MEISQLESFLAAMDAGSVSRAAKQLHLTQPAVTKQIHALEKELKTVLFERSGRGVAPTSSALVLRDYARQSLALLRECRETIESMSAGASGPLVLGAGVTTSVLHLPAWLSAMRAELPGIDITVRTGTSREVEQLVLDREVDLGLVTSLSKHRSLEAVPLLREEIVLVAARGTAKAAHLEELPLILFSRGTGFREYLESALAAAGQRVTVKMESDSLEAIKSFVAVGLGASFLPLAAVRGELESGSLVRVKVTGLPRLERETSAVFRKDRQLSPGAGRLVEIAGSG